MTATIERPEPAELPEMQAVRLARQKAMTVAARRPGCHVLAADTLVVADTADGGLSWRERAIEVSELAHGRAYVRARVHFLDTDRGWLLGQVATSSAFSIAELLRTADGGATWQRLPRPPAAGRFVFVDSQLGFMTGAPVSTRRPSRVPTIKAASGGGSSRRIFPGRKIMMASATSPTTTASTTG